MTLKKLSVLAAFACLILLSASSAQAQPVCVTFEPPLALGTTYGPPAHSPGDLAFTSNGIPVTLQKFAQSNGNNAFNLAYIDFAPFPFSPGQSIRSNNINLRFNVAKLGFIARKLSVSFLDLGGYENLSINGSPIHIGELTNAPAVLGGANVSVTSILLPPPTSGKRGTVTVSGAPITSLMIGGQELWIDQVCVS